MLKIWTSTFLKQFAPTNLSKNTGLTSYSWVYFNCDSTFNNYYLKKNAKTAPKTANNTEDFKNGSKWPPSKGYTLCRIVTLGQKLKMHKNMLKTFQKHIALVLCKKRLQKTANIRKMRAF